MIVKITEVAGREAVWEEVFTSASQRPRAAARESLLFRVTPVLLRLIPPVYGGVMDNRAEVREFLTSRRASITPEQAGLPAYGGNRLVTGLRREEVAMLAGMSIDYYVRLERGNLAGSSDAVLEGLARALQLDDAERAHLFDLASWAATAEQTGELATHTDD